MTTKCWPLDPGIFTARCSALPATPQNPAYKGKWSAPMIDNPAYKGVWAPRDIPNPDYVKDDTPLAHIGKVSTGSSTRGGAAVADRQPQPPGGCRCRRARGA